MEGLDRPADEGAEHDDQDEREGADVEGCERAVAATRGFWRDLVTETHLH